MHNVTQQNYKYSYMRNPMTIDYTMSTSHITWECGDDLTIHVSLAAGTAGVAYFIYGPKEAPHA